MIIVFCSIQDHRDNFNGIANILINESYITCMCCAFIKVIEVQKGARGIFFNNSWNVFQKQAEVSVLMIKESIIRRVDYMIVIKFKLMVDLCTSHTACTNPEELLRCSNRRSCKFIFFGL